VVVVVVLEEVDQLVAVEELVVLENQVEQTLGVIQPLL
jgi:hypothetical protein